MRFTKWCSVTVLRWFLSGLQLLCIVDKTINTNPIIIYYYLFSGHYKKYSHGVWPTKKHQNNPICHKIHPLF